MDAHEARWVDAMFGKGLVVYGFTFSLTFLLLVARGELQNEAAAIAKWSDVQVIAPPDQPSYSQQSIDLAMAMYGIETPRSARKPIFDPNLIDRGVTMRRGWSGTAEVRIGPAAFTSWALLGSTLAHEIEIHCRQSFFVISIMDLLGLDGTTVAEREAYLHELNHADRFGLSNLDQKLIFDTLDYYYPDRPTPMNEVTIAGQMTNSLRRMLAAPLQNQAVRARSNFFGTAHKDDR